MHRHSFDSCRQVTALVLRAPGRSGLAIWNARSSRKESADETGHTLGRRCKRRVTARGGISGVMASLESILSDNARSLVALVPAVRDGVTDAIHDARVATRRSVPPWTWSRTIVPSHTSRKRPPWPGESPGRSGALATLTCRWNCSPISSAECQLPPMVRESRVGISFVNARRRGATSSAKWTRCRSTHCQGWWRSGCRGSTTSWQPASASERVMCGGHSPRLGCVLPEARARGAGQYQEVALPARIQRLT